MNPNQPAIRYDAMGLKKACREIGARLLVAFGSRITGGPPPGPESDLDLALLVKNDFKQDFQKCFSKLSKVFPGYCLDMVFLHHADPLFRYEIMKNCILLFGDLDLFFEYKLFAYKDYLDSQDLRDLEEKLFQRKMNYIRRQLLETVNGKEYGAE